MPIYELAVATGFTGDRHKRWDIVGVRPYHFPWGLKENKLFLIILVEYPGGLKELERELKSEDFTHTVDVKKLAKKYPWLEERKATHKDLLYQPLRNINQVAERFDGKGGRKTLSGTEIDAGPEAEKETVFSYATFKDLITRRNR